MEKLHETYKREDWNKLRSSISKFNNKTIGLSMVSPENQYLESIGALVINSDGWLEVKNSQLMKDTIELFEKMSKYDMAVVHNYTT